MELRDTYNGFGESLSRAFELAVTPAVFGVAGYALDRWLGILPVLTIIFFVLAVTTLPVIVAQRLTRDAGLLRRR